MDSNELIEIGECRFGRGVFAARAIDQGEEILRFTGPIISLQEAEEKGETSANPLQIGPDTFMDLEEPGVLVNHSCDPNAGIVDDSRLVAISRIEKGEEIFYDYSATVSDDPWEMECFCETELCRGKIGDFKGLPRVVKQRYLRLNIVQRFIASDRSRWGADLDS